MTKKSLYIAILSPGVHQKYLENRARIKIWREEVILPSSSTINLIFKKKKKSFYVVYRYKH